MKLQRKNDRESQKAIRFTSSIVGKLSIGMLFWFMILGALGSFGLYNLKNFETSLAMLTENTLPRSGIASRLSLETSSLTGSVRRFALVDSQIQRRLVYDEINEEFKIVEALATELGTDGSTAAFAGILSTIKQLVDQLNNHIENRIVAEDASEAIATQLSGILNDDMTNLNGLSDQQKVQLLHWRNKVSGIVALAVQNVNVDRLRDMRVLRRNIIRELSELKAIKTSLPTGTVNEMQGQLALLEDLLLRDEGYFGSLVESLKLSARVRGLENQILTLNEEVTKLSNNVFRDTSLSVETSVQVVNKGFASQFDFTLLAGAITFLSIIAIAFIVNRLFVTRLNRLNKEVQYYDGHENDQITVSGNDEITGIANSVSLFIDEIESQQKELRSAKARAEDATKIKSEFLATMSHEIRTPMNGVVSMTQMLAQTELDHQQKELVDIVEQSAGSLLTIINDILDFSRIEAGKLEIEETELNICDLVASVSALCGADAYGKGLELFFDVDAEITPDIIGDSTRIRQILLNLTSNAVKFTEKGHVRIDAVLNRAVDGRDMIFFKVTDTGIGISDEAIQRLFVAFEQADGSTVRKFGGSGLGLSICKRLVDLMGGEIGVESAPGKGSTFYFSIPFKPIDKTDEVQSIDYHVSNIYVAARYEQSTSLITKALTTICDNLIILDASAPQSWNGMIRQTDTVNGRDIFLFDFDIDEHSPETPYLKAMANDFQMEMFAFVPRSKIALYETFAKGWLSDVIPKPINRFTLLEQIIAGQQHTPSVKEEGANLSVVETDAPITKASAVERDQSQADAILIAEDNPINQKVISTTLDHLGYNYKIVDDGIDAYEELEQRAYGIVLTDFHMPRMDGVMLTKMLKAHEEEAIRNVPVVILTADAQTDAQQICVRAGADGFLTKPINLKALSEELSKWLPEVAATAV
jgi:signal transduction histidine kinase/CheY-like chemotaxis protein